MKKLLFICSGNTCRSPLAEGLFKSYLQQNNITDIEASSAGLSVFSGDEVSINSALVAMNRGVDISLHRARKINPQHIVETDLFVCMTESHSTVISKYCDTSKIMTLNVPDPYGKSIEKYEECAKQIEKAFPQILERLNEIPTICEMREEHISSVADLEKICFSEPWSEDSLREELTNETARFFVLEFDGKVQGYIGANNICDEVYITNVAVNENARGKGYGKMLVNHLVLQSQFEDALFVTLEVRESNKNAIALYEKCGFKKIGERKNFYSKPTENGLIYTLYLKEI